MRRVAETAERRQSAAQGGWRHLVRGVVERGVVLGRVRPVAHGQQHGGRAHRGGEGHGGRGGTGGGREVPGTDGAVLERVGPVGGVDRSHAAPLLPDPPFPFTRGGGRGHLLELDR